MIGVSGCMFGKKKLIQPDEIRKYLEAKYDDTFVVEATGLQTMNSSKQRMSMRSEKLNRNISVAYDPEIKEIEEAVTDNYLSIALKEDIESILTPMAESVYGKTKVFFMPSRNPSFEPLPASTTAEELLSASDESRVVIAILPPDQTDYEERGAGFVNLLKEKGYYITLTIVYLNDENVFEDTNESNYDKYLNSIYRALRCDCDLTEDFDVQTMKWWK